MNCLTDPPNCLATLLETSEAAAMLAYMKRGVAVSKMVCGGIVSSLRVRVVVGVVAEVSVLL